MSEIGEARGGHDPVIMAYAGNRGLCRPSKLIFSHNNYGAMQVNVQTDYIVA